MIDEDYYGSRFGTRLTRAAASLHSGRVMIGIRKLGNGLRCPHVRRVESLFTSVARQAKPAQSGQCVQHIVEWQLVSFLSNLFLNLSSLTD